MTRTTVFLLATALLTLTAVAFRSGPPPAPEHTPPPYRPWVEPDGATTTPAPKRTPPPAPTVDMLAAAGIARAHVDDPVLRFEGRLANGLVPVGESDLFATFDLNAKLEEARPGKVRRPVSLALAIDRSGSMAGEKLHQAKRAASELVRQLDRRDRLAIVDYGSDLRLFHGALATEKGKAAMLDFIDAIFDHGSTNLSGGLDTAAEELDAAPDFHVRRLILISDGIPTEGRTAPAAILEDVARIREHGLTVSAIGVGEDFDASLMQNIARTGGGFFADLQRSEALAEIFQRELQQAVGTAVRSPTLWLEPGPGVRVVEVLGYSTREERGQVLVPLYDLSSGGGARVVVRLRVTGASAGEAQEVLHAGVRYTRARLDRPAAVELLLRATATTRTEAIAANDDQEVTVSATRAQAAQGMARAAEAYRRGDRAQALTLMDGVRGLFSDNIRNLFGASAEALAGDIQDLDATRARLSASSTSYRTGGAALDSKAMSNFGQNNSY